MWSIYPGYSNCHAILASLIDITNLPVKYNNYWQLWVTTFVSVKPNVPTDITHNCVYKYSYINTRCLLWLALTADFIVAGSMAQFSGLESADGCCHYTMAWIKQKKPEARRFQSNSINTRCPSRRLCEVFLFQSNCWLRKVCIYLTCSALKPSVIFYDFLTG